MKTSGGAGEREEQAGNAWDIAEVQGDTEELRKPPIDLVPTVPAAGGLLLPRKDGGISQIEANRRFS